jgi:hypothetical protein
MHRFKVFLIALCAAGCGGGGGSGTQDGGTGGDGHPGDGQGSNDAGTDGTGGQATNDHCATATAINLDTSMHLDLTASTTGATADLAPPCGGAGMPDVFFKFTLTRRQLVYADTFGASASTALFFASSCTTARTGVTTPNDAVCSTGACGTSQSQVVALLDPGTHYLVLAAQGAATIHFEHVEVGSGSVTYLPQGPSTLVGTTTGSGLLYECMAGGAENAYWWQTCPADAGGLFLASTCTDTDFDTVLSLQLPATGDVFCDDDSCGSFQRAAVGANIPAGAALHVIAVDGSSSAQHGIYTLSASRP